MYTVIIQRMYYVDDIDIIHRFVIFCTHLYNLVYTCRSEYKYPSPRRLRTVQRKQHVFDENLHTCASILFLALRATQDPEHGDILDPLC